MKKELRLNVILRSDDNSNLITAATSLNVDEISVYKHGVYYGGNHTSITMNNGNHAFYIEDYETVNRMITELRNQDIRLCYVIPIKTGTRYIPKDSVSHFFISKTNKLVTLTLNSGAKIVTGMTMPKLKETVKQVDMI